MQLPELNPPQRLLLGPGPSNVDARILRAMAAPVVGHLDPYFLGVMDETMALLRQLFGTANHHTVPISGTGSAGIETMLVNLLEPGDEAVVGSSGHFGQRLAAVAARTGARVRVVEAPLGRVIAPEAIAAALQAKPAKLVALVHAETGTGACQPLADIAAIAHRHGALVAVDCVTSLGGMPVPVDAWHLDAAASCSQKCLGAPPGLSPVTFGPRALAAIRQRQHPVQSWYLDLGLLFQYWGDGNGQNRIFHHTAPVTMIYALREALRLAVAEGLATRYARHARAHRALVAGLAAMGLSLFTPPEHQLPMLHVVNIPAGIDDLAVRRRLLRDNIEISGAFGSLAGKCWRIGLMGANAALPAITTLLAHLEQALVEQGYGLDRGAGVAAAVAAAGEI